MNNMNSDVINYINEFNNIFMGNFGFPKNSSRKNVLKKGDSYYQGFCLGIIYSWTHGKSWQISRLSKNPKYAPLLNLGYKLMNSYDPEFDCTSMQFNRNYVIAKHIDGNNVGESYIMGFGDYQGGELIVYNKQNEPTYVDIKNKFYKFNGSKFYHETAPFIGTRVTIVFFKLGPKTE